MSNGGRSATTSGARHASEGALHHSNAPSTPLLFRIVNCGQLRLCEVGALELARIGSLLFIFADSPNDKIGSSSLIDTFATRLSAQPLRCAGTFRYSSGIVPLHYGLSQLRF